MRDWLSVLGLRFIARGWRLPVYILGGVFAGLGLATLRVSEAASYLSDDPRACINCHVMTPQYGSWLHSSHMEVAVCTDCHVPHQSLLAKYAYKARDGLRHSAIFTLRLEPQVIRASRAAQGVIQANCLSCHARQLSRASLLTEHGQRCLDCHREEPHGTVTSLASAPDLLYPRLRPVTLLPKSGGDR